MLLDQGDRIKLDAHSKMLLKNYMTRTTSEITPTSASSPDSDFTLMSCQDTFRKIIPNFKLIPKTHHIYLNQPKHKQKV